MRIARLIAAMTFVAALSGCWYADYAPYPYPGAGAPHVGVALTRCGTCELNAAVLPPAPY